MEKLIELYCSVDDFSKQWEQHLITKGRSLRGPKTKMSIPEMMTISIVSLIQQRYKCAIIKELGEILAFQLTPGNISDVFVADALSQGIVESLYGDKGYISGKLGKKLMDRGLQLFTNLRAKMKNKCMDLRDKMLLRKRVIIETINDQLKNSSQIEHTRHRSVSNFLVNTLCAIAAYMRQPKKPRIRGPDKENLGLVSS